jgi:prepilin peptidase CpaA
VICLHLSYFSVNDYVLIALIGASLYFDLSKNKIPNFLTFPAIIYGIISYMVIEGLSGLWFSLLGLLVGLAIFFIPFAMGGMGGGDVKLLGAVGALQGWQFVLSAAIYGAIAGGVIAIIYLIANGRLLKMLKKIFGFVLAPLFRGFYYRTHLEFLNRASIYFSERDPESPKEAKAERMPYGVAIAAGVLILLSMEFFDWGEPLFISLPLQ